MTNKVFLSTIFGFLTGILLASLVSTNIYFVACAALIGTLFLVLAIANFVPRTSALVASLFFIAIAFGVLRFYIKDSAEPRHELDNFVEENVEVVGIIKSEVDVRQSSQRILLSAEKITLRGESYDIDQKILVSTELFPQYDYGERIKVSGKLKTPENFTTDIGKEFDYISYLRKDSIFYTMSFAHAEVLARGEGSKLVAGILFVKHRFLESIESVIPAPESALLGGLLLGTKQSLGDKLQQSFVDTGLVHIIVLSGYNVTIIAEALIKLLSFISISAGIYFGGLAIVLFVIMTGAGATIVRAGIMAILALVARATGRTSETTRALLLAAALMVLHNPYILFFDISFQLSFMATLGLIFVSPIFTKWFRFIPERFGLREVISATIGVQAFVLPFILYKMGNLSLVAPFTNTLVLPLIPMTMFFGFVSGSLGFISNILALPFGWLAYILLKFEIGVVEIFSRLPFATIKLAHLPFIIVVIFYGMAGWYLIRYYKNHEIK
jgi:competence protein ComEC